MLSRHTVVGRRATDVLAVRWLTRHRPTGDCWLEPTKALWLLAKFLKKVNDFNRLLAWHSRGRGFDSLQLHHEACQGVTEKSVTPFSLAPCQLTANAPVGSDSPGPGRLTHLLPHPRDDLLKIFNRLPGKNSSSPPNFPSRFGRLDISDALAAENERRYGGRRKKPPCVAGARQCGGIMLFSQNIPTGIALGVDIWTFGVHPLKIFLPHFSPAVSLADPVRDGAAGTGQWSHMGWDFLPVPLGLLELPRSSPPHHLPLSLGFAR